MKVPEEIPQATAQVIEEQHAVFRVWEIWNSVSCVDMCAECAWGDGTNDVVPS